MASELSQLEPEIRPDQIGSPFAIAGAGYFTDAQHQDHIQIGFSQPLSGDWKPPADVAATPAQQVAAAPVETAAAPVQPVAAPVQPAPVVAQAAAVTPAPAAAVPVEPAAPRNQSQMFQKVEASASSASGKPKGDSQAFLKAVDAPKATAAAVQPGAVQPVAAVAAVQPAAPGAVVDAAAAAASAAPDAYPGDNAPREQIAAWIAGQASRSAGSRRSCR